MSFSALATSITGKLLPARYRGAIFYVEDAGGAYGRRFADHEYPDRDEPFAEDLGRKQRVWPIVGYTLGPNFRLLGDALIRACEKKGPGTLYHPALGSMQAVCRSCTFREQRESGGRRIFTLEFAEPGKLLQPAGQPDTAQQLEIAADALGVAAEAAFLAMYAVDQAQQHVADFATNDVQATSIALERMRKPEYGVDQSAVSEALESLYDDAPQLVHAPPALASRTADCFAAFSDAGDPYGVGLSMLTFAAEYEAGADYVNTVPPVAPFTASAMAVPQPAAAAPPGTEFSSSDWVIRNQDAWERFAHEQALREVGYLTPAIDFTNRDQADRVLQAMALAFDVAESDAADAGNDQVFIALIDLRGACMLDIMTRREQLAPLVTYRMPRMTNAIVMAWRFYQDRNRDLELVEMADAYTPAYMPVTGVIRSS